MRNVCVIAHVDHGKTTFSDSLLSRAASSHLSDSRIGNCQLDSLQEERDRGITIAASAVTLLFELPADSRALADGVARARERVGGAAVVDAAAVDELADLSLHVDNVPFGFTDVQLLEALVGALPTHLQALHEQLQVRVRAKRGTASVECVGDRAHELFAALLAVRDLRAGERVARVERAGRGPMLLVQQRAVALGVPVPRFDVSGAASGERRAARHAAARAWLSANGGYEDDDGDDDDGLADGGAGGSSLLMALIDTPGHIDFSGQVTSSLRLSDGAFVLVDALSGPEPQTFSVLRQALREKVRVVLVLNKVDRCLHLEPGDVYEQLQRTIEVVNAALGGAQEPLSFAGGTVACSSALEGWGFSLESVLALYGARAGADVAALRRTLTSAKTAKKAFCDLVLQPIVRLRALVAGGQSEQALALLDKVGRTLRGRTLQTFKDAADANDVKSLTRIAMRTFMPLADCVVDLAARELPSPLEAQRVRVDCLLPAPLAAPPTGEDGADVAHAAEARLRAAVQRCSNDGPLLMFASKQVTFGGRTYTLARVLSGTVTTGQTVRVLASGEAEASGKVTSVALVAGSGQETLRLERAYCGNIVALCGLPIAQGTITDDAHARALPIPRSLVSHVVGAALTAPSSKRDGARKLIDALRVLTASDPSLGVQRSDEGELIIMGSGELHLDVSLSRLSTLAGFAVERSPPLVPLRETIVGASPRVYLGKSANKHNRIMVTAEPLEPAWRAALQAGSGGAVGDKARLALLRAADVPLADLRRVVVVGEADNVVIDGTTGVSLLPLVPSLIEAFHALERSGCLARGQQLTGVKLVITDVKYHADAPHRAPAQIVPAATRAFTAAILGSAIRLVEPMLAVDISVPIAQLDAVYRVLHARGAICDAADVSEERGFVSIHGRVSARASLGIADETRLATKGSAFPMLGADGWRVIDHDVYEHAATKAIVEEVRARCKLAPDLPVAEDDRL